MESLTRCDVSLIVNPVGCFPQLSLYLLLSRNLLSVIFLMFALASSTYLFHLTVAHVVRKGDQVTVATCFAAPTPHGAFSVCGEAGDRTKGKQLLYF